MDAMKTVRQLAWRVCYEAMARGLPKPDWSFMNYGYAPGPDRADGQPLALEPADEPDRLCIQLYEHVLEGLDLTDRDVLEVGSGRGGGASYVSRYRGPRSVTGVDLAHRAIALSRRHRSGNHLAFVHGDALALPFPDRSFDVVVNIESSHCYPDLNGFLAEVARVLRPQGVFAYADFRPASKMDGLRAQLAASPLTLESSHDITANVVAALAEDDDRKSGLIDAMVPRPLRRPFRRFAGVRGSATYDRFAAGDLQYVCARLTA